MNLFLDDIRNPSSAYNYTKDEIYLLKDWTIVRNYEEFVKTVEDHFKTFNVLPDLISFDHDLADIHYDPKTWIEGFVYQEKTGYDCAKWLVYFCIDNKVLLPEFMCHSQNPVGKINILGLLQSYKTQQYK